MIHLYHIIHVYHIIHLYHIIHVYHIIHLYHINFDIYYYYYYDSCKAVKEAISKRKSELMEQRVIDCAGDQKILFSLIHSLLCNKKNTVFPEYTSSFTLAYTINMFFR